MIDTKARFASKYGDEAISNNECGANAQIRFQLYAKAELGSHFINTTGVGNQQKYPSP